METTGRVSGAYRASGFRGLGKPFSPKPLRLLGEGEGLLFPLRLLVRHLLACRA